LNNNKLNLEALELSNNRYKKRVVEFPLYINDKEEYFDLEISEVFKPSDISACIEDYLDKLIVLRQYNNEYFQDLNEPILLFMMIKHFTSFDAPSKLGEIVKVIKLLLDNGLMYKIVSEFNEDEVKKVNKVLNEVANNIDKNVDNYIEYIESLNLKEKLEEMYGE